jgi:DNA modification methylase
MTAIVVQGDARHLPLPDASVDLVVTSPPYFSLRSYQDGGQHYDGQVGSETTPAAFVDALIECTREMVRVLKPSGSMFINLGDTYSRHIGVKGGHGQALQGRDDRYQTAGPRSAPSLWRIPAKSLIGMPWRYALRCIDDLGLILRAEIIWDKPNGLPESVTDRVRRSHEQWFHFSLNPRYYSAIDEVREESTDRSPTGIAPNKGMRDSTIGGRAAALSSKFRPNMHNPLGKLPGSVWSIPSQPLSVPAHLGVDHFAAFPCEWPRRIILGWSPGGVCVECGEGRRPEYDRNIVATRWRANRTTRDMANSDGRVAAGPAWQHGLGVYGHYELSRTGYACACPEPAAPTRPSVVLDPFAGTGTTCLVASAHGRAGIGVELSHDYVRLARWRCSDPGERARALKVAKPVKELEGQAELFEEMA